MQYPNLATNAYFRFVFKNLKITKWGYRYILKISLRSNPACYTIETTFGPFNVRARATTPQITKSGSSANSSNSNELRYIWTTSKCHSVKMDLQVSVIPERGGFQMFDPSTTTAAIVPSIPTSRFIDYLCDLNIEKLTTFLINFLANRASASNGDLLPAQLRLPSTESTGTKTKLKKQFTVKRDFSFTNENDYTSFVTNFVQYNRLSINGSQCLEMSLQSNNFSLIEATSSTNHSSILSDMFQTYYQAFHSHHKQQLNRRLINMTFIYSSELLLKIKQVYLDDKPLYKAPPLPTNPPNKHVKTVKIESNPPHSSKTSIPESNNRNVGKRKTGVSLPPLEEKEEDDDNDDENESFLTRSTQSPQSIDRSRKITANKKPELIIPKNTDVTESRLNSRTKVVQSKSATTTPKTMPKIVFKKGKTKTTQSASDSEEGETSTTAPERNFLTGRPLLWVAILFANTLLVFGFIILFAICYYKSM